MQRPRAIRGSNEGRARERVAAAVGLKQHTYERGATVLREAPAEILG